MNSYELERQILQEDNKYRISQKEIQDLKTIISTEKGYRKNSNVKDIELVNKLSEEMNSICPISDHPDFLYENDNETEDYKLDDEDIINARNEGKKEGMLEVGLGGLLFGIFLLITSYFFKIKKKETKRTKKKEKSKKINSVDNISAQKEQPEQ